MDRVDHRPQRPRSVIGALVAFGSVVGILAVLAPDAAAVKNTCRATNLTQGTPSRSNLQAAINAAHPGDKISVAGCLRRQLHDRQEPHPRGQADSRWRDARPAWRRRLGACPSRGCASDAHEPEGHGRPDQGAQRDTGGGILVWKGGVLTLNRSVIAGNSSKYEGGGIANYGRLVLNGSSVTRNSAGSRRRDLELRRARPERLVLGAREHGLPGRRDRELRHSRLERLVHRGRERRLRGRWDPPRDRSARPRPHAHHERFVLGARERGD